MAMSPRLLRPRATGFNPSKIAGLQLWLDAADSSTITVDTGVSQWRDKSSTGSVYAQAVGNNQPATGTQTINGKNVVVFDGTNDGLSAPDPLSTSMPVTFFLVQRIVSATAFGMSYAAGSGNDFNLRQGNPGGFVQVSSNVPVGNSVVYNGSSNEVGQNNILSLTFPASGSAAALIHSNGLQQTVASPLQRPVLAGTHFIGRRADGNHANVGIAEIVAYSAELSTLQRRTVESYLGKKWGITVA